MGTMGGFETEPPRPKQPDFCEGTPADSPLLNLPIRHVMGGAHYVPQSSLSEMSGHGACRMARSAPGGVAAGAIFPCCVHLAGAGVGCR